LAFSYLLNPSLSYSLLYDFHPVTLATSFLLFSWYFLLKKRIILFLVFVLLAGLTKEQVWFVSGALFTYAFFQTRDKALMAIAGLFSFCMFYYLIWVAIPAAHEGHHFALSYFEEFGSTPTEVIRTILLNPGKSIPILFSENRLEYAKRLLLPLGLLPLLHPLTLIFAIPDFAINFLSSNPNFRAIYYQYTAVITSFLFISASYGALRIRKIMPLVSYFIISFFLLTFTLYSAYTYGPLPASNRPNIDMYTKQLPYSEFVSSALKSVPSNASVAATNNLGAHLSHREYLFTIPVGTYEADYVAFLLNDSFAQPSPEAQRQMVEELKLNPNYEVIAEKEIFILFRKR
jgi:uncharacterized membrane protein